MKRNIIIVILLMLSSFFGSCITFRSEHLFPNDNQVECIHLCKGMEDSGDLLKPVDIQSDFTSKDDHINCFIKLKDVSIKIRLRWKWYSPDRKMFRDTGDVIVNQDEEYLGVVTAYDMLQLNPGSKNEGQWTVVVFMNDKFIGSKTFQVRHLKLSEDFLFPLKNSIVNQSQMGRT